MVKRTGIVFIFLLALVPSFLGAESGVSRGAEFSIRFYDKRIYHAAGEGNEPIYVQATVTNRSSEVFRFKLAEERAFSIEFDIRTLTNRAVEAADTLIRRRTTSGRIFFREITVESGESFSFIEDLRNYADLKEPGAFVVTARIYPELYRPENDRDSREEAGRGTVLESNRLSLSLRPPVIPGPGGIPAAIDLDTGAVLGKERLAPDEVVEYLISARQKSQWEKFFLYLDLEELISRNPARRRQWIAESEEGRRRMLERYREEMRQDVIDGDITAIPFEFEIQRTDYNALEGTVVVLEKFRTGTNYTERKRYTYYIKRKDDYWVIVDYVVANLGTE
ncbi:MAG: hypothetical protein LBB77_12575 [Treponema sp.]|jgi:hypothetical protein|nr:hypothetical protein [Treponema sp.]